MELREKIRAEAIGGGAHGACRLKIYLSMAGPMFPGGSAYGYDATNSELMRLEDPLGWICVSKSHISKGRIDGMGILVRYECGAMCFIDDGGFLPTQESLVENIYTSLDYEGGTYSIDTPRVDITFLTRKAVKLSVNTVDKRSRHGSSEHPRQKPVCPSVSVRNHGRQKVVQRPRMAYEVLRNAMCN